MSAILKIHRPVAHAVCTAFFQNEQVLVAEFFLRHRCTTFGIEASRTAKWGWCTFPLSQALEFSYVNPSQPCLRCQCVSFFSCLVRQLEERRLQSPPARLLGSLAATTASFVVLSGYLSCLHSFCGRQEQVWFVGS